MGKKCKENLPRPDTKKGGLETWKKRLGKSHLNEDAGLLYRGTDRGDRANVLCQNPAWGVNPNVEEAEKYQGWREFSNLMF